MSETTEAEPRKVRIGLLPVLVLITAVVAVGIWLALSQNRAPSTPEPVAVATSAAPTPTASASPSPSVSPTVRPAPTADEALTANLGRGYELRDENGNSVPLCEARRFVAPYNIDAGEPRPGASFSLDTAEGLIEVFPYQNDSRGYQGVITVHC